MFQSPTKLIFPPLLAALAACSVMTPPANELLLERLENQGPFAVSRDNPYLAANLLLSKEVEVSQEMRGFIQHRGNPDVIEISNGLLSSRWMYFYYPANQEKYTLESKKGVWIITGPEKIAPKKLEELAPWAGQAQEKGPFHRDNPALTADPAMASLNLPASEKAAPEVKPASLTAAYKREEETASVPPREQQTASISFASFKSPRLPGPAADPPQPLPGAPLTSRRTDSLELDELISSAGQHLAEISPRGDVVHHVTYPGESLNAVSRWYTLDQTNADKLARINRIAQDQALLPGDQVVVPAYLARNKVRLTEQALKILNAAR